MPLAGIQCIEGLLTGSLALDLLYLQLTKWYLLEMPQMFLCYKCDAVFAYHKHLLCFVAGTDCHQDLQLMPAMRKSALGISHPGQTEQNVSELTELLVLSVSGITASLALPGISLAAPPVWKHPGAKPLTRQQSPTCHLPQPKQPQPSRSDSSFVRLSHTTFRHVLIHFDPSVPTCSI